MILPLPAILSRDERPQDQAAPALSPEQAQARLADSAPDAAPPDEHVARLADHLGCVELAVDHAAAAMRDRRLTARQYLDLLAVHSASPAWTREPEPAPDPIAATWKLLADIADEYQPAGIARRVLDMIALLDPRGTPADLFSTEPVVDHLSAPLNHTITSAEIRDVLLRLHRLGLLSVSLTGGDRVARMSSAQQGAARQLLPAKRHATMAQVLADALVQRWPSVVADLDLDLLRLLRCATTLTEHGGAELLRGGADCHRLLRLIGQSLAQLDLLSSARDYTRSLVDRMTEALGPDHPETLRARADAASWRGRTRERIGSADEWSGLIADCHRVLGAEYPETLEARANLASNRARNGDVREAIGELETVLAIQARTQGEVHASTLTTRARLTNWRARAGLDTPDVTITVLDSVLNGFWEHPPTEFRDIFRTRSSLATALIHKRRPVEGAYMYQQLLADQLRLFGTDTPETITTRRRLVRAYEASGNQRALRYAQRQLVDRERWVIARYEHLFGADQPDVLAMRTSASIPDPQDDAASHEIARLHQLRAELTLRNGPDDLDTLRAWSNLAVAIGRSGDAEAAVTELSALRDHAERALGETHLEVLTILSRLASWEGRAKYRASAVTTLKTLLARQGEDHPHYTTALYNLAQQHRRRGNSIGYGDTLSQLITFQQHQHLPQDPLMLKARLELVTWRARHGATTIVVSDLQQIVKECRDRLGRQHADTLAAEFHLAHWLWETGYPEDARNRLTALLPQQRKIHGPRSRQTTEATRTLERWRTTLPPPPEPPVPPVDDPANGTSAKRLGTLLSRFAEREHIAAALLEVLALVPDRVLSSEVWQASATAYCATAIVEQTDLDALLAAAHSVVTANTDDCGRTTHRIADVELARSVLHRAARRTGLPQNVDTELRRSQVDRLIFNWERQHTPPGPDDEQAICEDRQ